MTYKYPLLKICLVILLTLGINQGCDKVTPPVGVTRDAAQQNFINMVAEKYQYPMVVRQVENTLWIYLPIKTSLIEIKASKDGPSKSNQPSEKSSLKFMDTKYDGKNFSIEYDIEKSKNYAQSYGYSSTYAEEFQRMQSNIFAILQRAYFDVGLVPGDHPFLDSKQEKTHSDLVDAHLKTDQPPEFIVLVITDIVNGLEIINTFNFDDFKRVRSNTPSLSQSEYVNRNLSRVEGNREAIDDVEGKHLPFTAVTMGDFIAEQITHRVNFKYTSSSFPPGENAVEEIKISAAQSIGAYKFPQFESINITNLADSTNTSFTKEQILALPQAKEQPEGKIHIINFLSPQNEDR
ncbi:MAG: hypothetical protein KBD53_07020 [Candidatus Omnitrophica bacterium]|nr:hypothetical protein [Candidatus Omnitrophota bacterium]